jgi:hypothetical protein
VGREGDGATPRPPPRQRSVLKPSVAKRYSAPNEDDRGGKGGDETAGANKERVVARGGAQAGDDDGESGEHTLVRTGVSTSASIDIARTYALARDAPARIPSPSLSPSSFTPIPISSCARLDASTPPITSMRSIYANVSRGVVEGGKNGESGGKWGRPRSAREAGRRRAAGAASRACARHEVLTYPDFKIAVPFANVARTCAPHSHAGQRESGKGTA